MKNRSILFVLVVLLCSLTSLAALAAPATNWISLDGVSRPVSGSEDALKLLGSDDAGLTVSSKFAGIESFDVQTSQGMFSQINIPGAGNSNRIGDPMLPEVRRIISVPLGATVELGITRSTTQEISLAASGIANPLMPAQPSLAKNQNPADVPFAYNSAAYAATGYGDRPVVHVEEIGVLRGMRLMTLVIEPVRYDPSRRTLTVYNHLEVSVRFNGADLTATRDLRARTLSPFFESVYSQHVLNYRWDSSLDDDITRYPIKMVIVADPMFTAQLQPFIQWKTKQGYNVIVGYTNNPSVGTTTTSIRNYLMGLYNAGTPSDPAPSFVLFVGDIAQIPTWAGTTATHPTDVHYVTSTSATFVPLMYFARFSATSTAELQPQIDKTLEYEQYTMPNPSYLGQVVMIGGADATYGPVWANGQINYGTTYYFNATHGITSNTYLYPASASAEAAIIANINAGVGYANYTAHGSEDGWADPTLSRADVAAFTNAHKYPLMVGNCCLTNKFDVAACFGETLLRSANKGAVGYIGASNYSYWDEDYWWGVGYRASVVLNPTYDATHLGAYDGMFHDHGEAAADWYFSAASFIMAGNLAVVQSGSSLTNYYWEVYQLMGDPSLLAYFGVPTTNTASYPPSLFLGQTTATVTADAYSYVGLSQNGALLAAGRVPAGGSLTLNFAGLTNPGTADIVICRQNRIPVISTIQIVANDGPYLMTSNQQISDVAHGDGDGLCDFGEALDVTLTENNIGTVAATGVTVNLATTDPYLTLTDASEVYGWVGAGQEVSVPNGFAATVSPTVPDGRVLHVDITATDDAAHTWTDDFSVTAHAPNISISSVIVNDATGNNNGVMDPGESVSLTFNLNNAGSAGASTLVGTLTTDYEFASISQPTGTLATLNPAQTAGLTAFTLAISPSAPPMDRAYLYLTLTMAGGRTDHLMLEMSIGGFLEGVENGQGSWTHAANQTGWTDQWQIVTARSHSTTHSWKCGANDTTTVYANHMDAGLITPSISLPGHTELRFWHRITGETSTTYTDSAYDAGILEISVNSGAWTQVTPTSGGYNKWIRCTAGGSNPYTGPFAGRTPCWSGTIGWTEVVCDLAAYTGSTVSFRFRFGSDNGGGKEGWYVDDIRVSLVTSDGAPSNLTAELIGSNAHLTWQSPASGALTSTLLGYNIYRDEVKIDSLIQTITYDNSLTGLPFRSYSYRVSAQFSAGESAESNVAVVNWNLTPDPVTDLTMYVDGADLILRWTPVATATSYAIYSSSDVSSFNDAAITTATGSTITLAGEAANWDRHFYLVKSVR